MATFYIEAIEATQIALVKNGSPHIGTVKYGVNDPTCPNSYTVTTASTPISLTAGQKCYWTITSTTTTFSTSNYMTFTSTGRINVGGALSDLIGGNSSLPRNYCFYSLFRDCNKLVDASNLVMVNDFNSRTNCYFSMFQDCTSLTTVPELPATTLTSACYRQMFQGCTSLTIVPELPATTLTSSCYQGMFYGCTSIRISSASTDTYQIQYRIPSNGTGGIEAEATNSLTSMFYGTGGTFAGTPNINTTYYIASPATFYIEAIEATQIALVKVDSPTVGTAKYGINNSSVPNTYTYGNTISLSAGDKCYWTITSITSAFSSSKYLKFTSTGQINVGGALSDLIGGNNSIPRNYCFCRLFYGCDKLVDASNLVMVNDFNSRAYCYYHMFRGCASLTTAPTLPATMLTNACYSDMFLGCTSLTTAPELPATTLADYCYSYMFYGCTSLTTAPELPATTLADSCYQSMFYGCTSLTTAPELPASTLKTSCYREMFLGCTSLKLSKTQTSEYRVSYRIPSRGTGTVSGANEVTDMFTNTGGTFTGTPAINTTYYMPLPTTPTTVTYKGQQLAEFDSGIKTLKCSGKYMEDDIVVYREKGTATIGYNGATIATVTDGTKTLKCAGKLMAGDVIITNE